MSATPNDSCYIFVVDTDKYAGNFERPMCAYMTGCVGDCEVGQDKAEEFVEDIQDDRIASEFDEGVLQVADEHGCYRPVSIWPTPGWGNNGMGKHAQLDGENDKVYHWPAYMSVAIFFQERPSTELIDLMKKRAAEYVELYKKEKFGEKIKISGFRLIKHDVKVEESEEVI